MKPMSTYFSLGLRIEAGGERAQQIIPAGGDPIGNHRRQRADDGVGIGRAQVIAERGRLRIARIEDGAFGNDDVDRADHALVVRDVGIDELQEGEQGRRRARRIGAVDEAVGLRVGLGIIEFHMRVFDRDGDADGEFRALVMAVEIDHAFAAIDAVRDVRDFRLHHLLGGVEQRRLVGLENIAAVFLQQRAHPPLADGAGAHLGFQIVLHDVEADIGKDQIPDVAAQLALLVDLYGRNAQRLLPDFLGIGIVAARHGAADIGLMALHRRPRHQRAVVEDRLIDGDVVVLVAEAEHVVVEDHVAVVNVVAEIAHQVLAHRAEREGEDRQVLGLLQHIAVGVVEPGDEILGLAQDRRARGLRPPRRSSRR